MSQPAPKHDFGKELEAITSETGAAIVRVGERTYVVVEMEGEPSPSPTAVYHVTDPDEAAELRDAMDDTDNQSFTTEDAIKYLQSLRMKRAGHGRG